MTEGKIDSDLFCFMPHSCCENAHSRCICRFNIDIIVITAVLSSIDVMSMAGFSTQWDTVDAEIKILC